MKTVIYGYSDDLIEIDGEVSEEVNSYSNGKVSCSDGTKATIAFNGTWDIKILKEGLLFDKKVSGNPEETPHTDIDCKGLAPGYSDCLVLKEGIKWVKIDNKKINS